MRVILLILSVNLLLLMSCGNSQSENKSASNAGPVVKGMPNWVVGSWSGGYSDAENSISISYDVSISASGRLRQISSIHGGGSDTIYGQCQSVQHGCIPVILDGDSSRIIYYLNERQHQLGISENTWLIKLKE
ncbi:MAG: hypothetical protein LKF31_02415 [Muribaculaceae bacterium]|jgi:hypothetical protein|nr:hypothetical protein [Muribaculaceae bacterium]